jgi:hypothetical protein
MAKTQIIEYQGKKIFFIDFSNLKSFDEINEVTKEAKLYIHSQTPKTVFTLTSVEGTHFNNEIKEMFTEYVKSNKNYVKASAVIGVSGLKQIMYNTMMRLTGRDTRSFDTIEQAKTWLVSQN